MSYLLRANCSTCSFDKKLDYGSSRFNFKNENPIPAIEKETNKILSVDYEKYENDNSFIFFTDKELKSKSKNSEIFRNFNFEINSQNNYCPNCREYNLNFEIDILYD